MPKMARTQREIVAENLMANISCEAERKKAGAEELAKAAGMAVSTYYECARNPMRFRLEHILGLAGYFRMNPEDLLIDHRKKAAK